MSGYTSWAQCFPGPVQPRKCITHSKASSRVERILKLLESSPLDERPCFPRRDPALQPDVCYHQTRGLDEANRPDGPREARRGQQLPRHRREDQPSRRAPAGRHSDGQSSLLAEIRGHGCHRGTEEAAVAEAHAHALSQEQLPVLGAHGCGEDTQQLESCSEEEHLPEVLRKPESVILGLEWTKRRTSCLVALHCL